MDQVRTQSKKRMLLAGAILASLSLLALFLPDARLQIAKASAMGPALGLAPAGAQQSSASQIDASPLMKWIQSIPQAPRLQILKERLAPLAPALAPSAPALMPLAPVTITKDASPISGSAVGQGQVIAYTIQSTNGASSDTTTGAGGFVRIIDTAPAGTLFTNATVQQQPQFGSAWSCTILGGGTSIQCVAGDGAGAGVDTFTTQEFVRIRAEVTVGAATAIGTVLTNTATYQFDNDGGGLEGNATSNATVHVVQPTADLAITKSALTVAGGVFGAAVTAGGNVSPGFGIGNVGLGEIEYTLTYRNNGPGEASNVHVRDVIPGGTLLDPTFLPIGVVVTPAAGPGLTCQILPTLNSYELDCTPNTAGGVLPAGSNGTIQFSVRVPENIADGAVIRNQASINSEGGANPATLDLSAANNNSAETQNIVRTSADLAIDKTTDNATPVAGGAAFSYTLVVTNNGPSNAQNVIVTDPLPQGANFISASSNDGTYSCTASSGIVTCIKGTVIGPAVNPPPIIPPQTGSNVSTITIVAQYGPNFASGVRTNTATVNSSTSDPVAVNNSDSVGQNIQVNAPLSITKAGPATLCPGQQYTYHITVNNGGSSTALNATISDPLPANTTFLGLSGTGGFVNGCSHNGGSPGTVTCASVDIPSGLSTLDISVELGAGAPAGPLQNTATITTAGTGTIAVGSSTTTATVANDCAGLAADLAASKTAIGVVDPDGAGPLAPVALPIVGPNVPPGSVNAGGYIRYDVPFGNAGTGDARNVMITDPIPGNTAFVGALATGGVFVPAAQPPAVPFSFTIQAVDTSAPLGPNVNLTCVVNGAAGSQTIYCRPLSNTGNGIADGTLPDGYNGQLTFFVKVNESVAGGTIVSNPANITSGLCANGAGPVPPPFPPIVCESSPDPNSSNNTTLQAQTVVVASSNLTISKIVQSAVTAASNPNQTGPIGPATPPNGAGVTGTAVLPGTFLTYRLIVTNNGPSDVSNIRLTDVLPSGLETPPGRVLGVRYISINPVIPSGATFTCSAPTGVNPANNPQANGGSVACTAPLLSANAPNNTAAVDITVFIDPATRASVVNTATVDATINNFNRPISGSATLTTPVAATSDLALTKTHIDATGIPGGPIITPNYYIITATNNGPSSASSFSLTDTFPAFQKVTQIEIGRFNDSNVFVTPNSKDGNGNPIVSCGTVPAIGSPGNTTSMTCTAQSLPPNKNIDGTVNPAGTVVFRVSIVQDPFTPPGPQTNCVSATSASTDPIPGNNTGVCDNSVQFFFVPLAFDDHYFTLKDVVLDVPAPGVLSNDLGYLPPTAVPINNGLTQQGGRVTLSADGSFTYTPPAGFSGTDGFDYTAINNIGSDVGHVELTVTDPATIALRISEFRFNGPNGATDEFFEIYNASPTDHLVGTTAGSNDGGYGLFASAGNGVTSNTVTLICMIPNGTIIPARGYVLCTGSGYSLAALGSIGSSTGSAITPVITGAAPTAVGNFPIINGTPGKPGVYSSVDVPNDAGLVLANVGDNTVGASANIPDNGDFGFEATGVSPADFTVYDRVGFAAYGSGAPLQVCPLANPASCGVSGDARPSLADMYCETSAAQCLRPVGDASTTNHGAFVFYGDSGQYSLLRRQTIDQSATIGTVPQDTANNADDFVMVSPVPGTNIAFNITNFPTGLTPGLVSVLGAAGPQNNAAPADLPETRLQSSLFDLTKTSTQLPNAERRYVIDTTNTIINNNPMGSFIFRFGFRNTSAAIAINRLRFRVDNLSVPCGQASPAPAAATVGSGNARNLHQTAPDCQGSDNKTAVLKMLNMPTELVAPESGPVQTVRGSVIEDTDGTKLAPNGGGINNSLVRTGTTQGSLTGEFTTVVPAGSPGPKFFIAFRMGVVRGGSFRFLFQPEGSSTAAVPLPTVP